MFIFPYFGKKIVEKLHYTNIILLQFIKRQIDLAYNLSIKTRGRNHENQLCRYW